jgi:DNA-binding NarL/FixJ family response regulator
LDEIRVLLIDMRGVLGDVIRTVLLDCDDLNVVANRTDAVDARTAIVRSRADVVVCALDDEQAADVATALFEPHQRTKVIAIRDDGREAVLWELHPRRRVLGDLSPRLLVDTVRRVSQ